ncbi:hypothetical protein COV18_06665 [Candidatus Woesearchaeota archaeon CG10_big_fil_rev_8_21_14_0_10_37_12]|nr:MAG: hypothetical protein COV18_06665 [Candidatus Woesearchaeota archaeon CG10_big_fil_rev_8_21_14_0_10_37_12]
MTNSVMEEKMKLAMTMTLLLLLSVACGNTEKTNEIHIAGLLPLTGDFALYGTDEAAIADFFVEEWNRDHELKLNFFVEDTQSNARVAVSALQKLLVQESDVVIITPAPAALAVQSVLNENRILSFAVDVNPNLAKGYMVQNWPTSDEYAKQTIAEMRRKNHTKMGLIYRNDELGSSVKDSIIALFDGDLFVEATDPETKDFRAQITKISAKTPDAIFIIGSGATLGLAIKQIRAIMGNITIYSGPEIGYPDVQESTGEDFHNIVYADLNFDYTQPKLKAFKEKYVAHFGREPSPDSIVGYNAIVLFTSCIPFESKEALLTCVKNTEVEGLTGKVSVKNNLIDYSEIMTLQTV